MWRSLASWGEPSEFFSILCNYGKSSLRRQLSGQSRIKRFAQPWTTEEDHKLQNLHRQGFGINHIVGELNRSYGSISKRLSVLHGGTVPKTNKRKLWSVEEEAFLWEKHQQGLTRVEIATCFPGRTFNSIDHRVSRLKSLTEGQRQTALQSRQQEFRELTGVHVERVVDMRLREAKSYEEIAIELGCSVQQVDTFWYRHCQPTLSEEARESIRRQRGWTLQEMEHLKELYRCGTMQRREVVLQFPSKTKEAVFSKIKRELLRFPRPTKKRSVSALKSAEASAISDNVKAESKASGELE